MRKLVAHLLAVLLVFLLAHAASAQQAGKSTRIGYLEDSTAAGRAELLEVFRQQMSQLGWVEGKNLTIEYRFGEGKGPDRLAELAAELAGKRLEILKEVVPRSTRVGVLGVAGRGRGAQLQFKEMKAAALALGLKLEQVGVAIDSEGLEIAFQTAVRERVNVVITISSPVIFSQRKRIVELAGKYRLPAIYSQKEFVDEGGLMSYGIDYRDLHRRAATYVDKILRGTKPADLPVEQPTKFEFVINLKAAKQIGVTIPPNILARADNVIK